MMTRNDNIQSPFIRELRLVVFKDSKLGYKIHVNISSAQEEKPC
jgi:hypothetical protein